MTGLPWHARLAARGVSIVELLSHFTRKQKLLVIPLLCVLLLSAILLALTSGLSYVAPFVYALF